MELPEHTEPSLTSQKAPSPRPFSPGVQQVIRRLSVKPTTSCSSKGSGKSELPDVSHTDLPPQNISVTNIFDIASLSPEPEETIVEKQFHPHYDHTVMPESTIVNTGQCRNENAKHIDEPAVPTKAPRGPTAEAEGDETKQDPETMSNKTDSKSVQFQTNVRVYPSPSARQNDEAGEGTFESLSDQPPEELRVGEDYKTPRPATPGNTSVPQTSVLENGRENHHTTSPESEESRKNPDYTPHIPRDNLPHENQHIQTWIEESKPEIYDEEVGSNPALYADPCNVSTNPDNGLVLEKAKRRADRKKRKEMRMAAEGYIKEQVIPQEEKCKKKSKKKKIKQEDDKLYSEGQAEATEYGPGQQGTVIRLEAERDMETQGSATVSYSSYEEKLEQWEKMKRKGDIRTPDIQDGITKPGKKRIKKKKQKETLAARDEDMKCTENFPIEYEMKREEARLIEEEARNYREAMENSPVHQQSLDYYKTRNMEDTRLNCSNNKELNTSVEKAEQSTENKSDKVSMEKLSQEERRRKCAQRKREKEAKAAYDHGLSVKQEQETESSEGKDISTQRNKAEGLPEYYNEKEGLLANCEEQVISGDFKAIQGEESSSTSFKKENTHCKTKKKLKEVTHGEGLQEQNSKQKRKERKMKYEDANCSETPAIKDEDMMVSESILNTEFNAEENLVPEKSNKKYVDAGVGPTLLANQTFNGKPTGVRSKNTKRYKQQSQGHLIGQQYLVDQQNVSISPEDDDDNIQFVPKEDRPRPVGCDDDTTQRETTIDKRETTIDKREITLDKREITLDKEAVVRRINQSGPNRPESRSLWSNSNMSIPHSIQEVDETEELEDPATDSKDPPLDTGQENPIKFPAPGPREELAPSVFKVDKMNLPPVCLVQEEVAATAGVRKQAFGVTDVDHNPGSQDNTALDKQKRADAVENQTLSHEVDNLMNDLRSEVELRLTPNQTWEEITRPAGHFRPKVNNPADPEELRQGQTPHNPEKNDDPKNDRTFLLENLSEKQKAQYEKLQVTFRAPEKNLPGAQFWKDLSADKLKSESAQDLFIKTPFGNIFQNESEMNPMSPLKAYCDQQSHENGASLDETGYESMEQAENYEDTESLSDLRQKLRTLCSAEDDSVPLQQQSSPNVEGDLNEASADPRYWKSTSTPKRDAKLSAEVLARIANRAAQNAEKLQFGDEYGSYQEEDEQNYKEPSYAPSLTDRYHRNKEENLDFFRCVSRATQNKSKALKSEEENIMRSYARTDAGEYTLDRETADGNLLFFQTVSKYPEFYDEADAMESKIVKSRAGRRSPGYIPDDPNNYISRDVAHQNLEFFRAVARDTSFFQMPDSEQENEEDSEGESTPRRNAIAPEPSTEQKETPNLYSEPNSHQNTKPKSQQPASRISNRVHSNTYSSAKDTYEYYHHPGPPKPLSRMFSKKNDALSLIQPVVSAGKAKENMDFFLQVSKDPHFYKVAEKPEVPTLAAPDVKPRPYKSYVGINVNSGRPIGKKGLGFKSRYSS